MRIEKNIEKNKPLVEQRHNLFYNFALSILMAHSSNG